MKNKHFLITVLLVLSIILANIPITVYASIFDIAHKLFEQYTNKTEEQIYAMKLKDSKENLLAEIKSMDKELSGSDKIAILPHAMALVEKKDEFSQDEIIGLLNNKETEGMLEGALIRIYIGKNYDKNKLLEFIDNACIDLESKESIVSLSDLSNDELKNIFYKNNSRIVIIAMKRLMVSDYKMAFDIALDTFMKDTDNITDEKLLSSLLGIGEYYSRNDVNDEQKANIVEKMKKLFDTSKNELIKDNVIYSMARMKDFKIFKDIIENENVDIPLKISAIERNLNLIINKISTNASSKDEISCIEAAMKIHPILEVGEVLKKSIDNGLYKNNSTLLETIKYIENNGVKGVFKYE